ncbi:MAG: T9SS type A sorting domain-containing protein [Flavobacteriales bacterium]
MKKLPLLTAALILVFNSRAQQTFEKYYLATGTASMTLDELSNGNLFTGIAYQSGISLMDAQGNILQTHCYDLIPFLVLQSVRKHTDNEIRFVGGYLPGSCSVGSGTAANPVIGKMDSLGNILAINQYQLNAINCFNVASDLVITNDGGVVTWGRDQSPFALRVDAAGMPIWSKQFNHHGSFGFIQELPSGDLLAGLNMDTAGMTVARLDANGDILWCKSYFRPKGKTYDCLIESDSSFIIIGATDSLAAGNQKLFMMRLNGTGDVEWCRGYHTMQYWMPYSRIVRSNDDNYVVLATLSNAGRPFLMKTDQNGDTLWSRSAGVSGYGYFTTSILAAGDGGFYYDGGAEGDFGLWSSAAYLFKTDSLGHLPCSEASPPPIVVSDLFPVDSSFTLSSISGATAFPITVADAFYDPVVTYDGCTITSVINPMRPNKFRVRPNPTSGLVTVEFEDPLMAESYYSVYDAMGRLLYQRPLPAGATTEEIDLSRYGKGTYAIKLTDKEGVRFERVVLE